MSLPDWQKNGWLTAHKSSVSEVRDLLGVLDRDLKDSAVDDISTDARVREQHHYRVIQSLSLTIGATAAEVATLDAFRKKRNVSDYDRAGTTSQAEVGELRALAVGLRERVIAWVKTNHAAFLKA